MISTPFEKCQSNWIITRGHLGLMIVSRQPWSASDISDLKRILKGNHGNIPPIYWLNKWQIHVNTSISPTWSIAFFCLLRFKHQSSNSKFSHENESNSMIIGILKSESLAHSHSSPSWSLWVLSDWLGVFSSKSKALELCRNSRQWTNFPTGTPFCDVPKG